MIIIIYIYTYILILFNTFHSLVQQMRERYIKEKEGYNLETSPSSTHATHNILLWHSLLTLGCHTGSIDPAFFKGLQHLSARKNRYKNKPFFFDAVIKYIK